MVKLKQKRLNKEWLWRWKERRACGTAPWERAYWLCSLQIVSMLVCTATYKCALEETQHTSRLMHFFLSISKVSSVFIKAEDWQDCWLKQSTTTREAFTLQALGPGRAARCVEGEEGGQRNPTPGYCWESLVGTLAKYVGGVLWCRALEKAIGSTFLCIYPSD